MPNSSKPTEAATTTDPSHDPTGSMPKEQSATVRLERTVRLCVNPKGVNDVGGANGYAGKPAMVGLGRYYELDVRCRGDRDETTGYLIGIQDIDAVIRGEPARVLNELCHDRPMTDPSRALLELWAVTSKTMPVELERLRLWLTPTYAVEREALMPSDTVVLRQRFDFAAAHRLHADGLSDAENRKVFGKCNNPAGHGHNYQVEPRVSVRVVDGRPTMDLPTLERLVDETVIAAFDHKHLNEDVVAFSGTTIPSVENIAIEAHRLLVKTIADAGGDLLDVTVWETDRTSATYPASS